MNDYDLIAQVKQKDAEASEILFLRYKPFIYKHYLWLQKEITNVPLDAEDFFAEAYFSYLKAVEYVDLSKIYDPENWKFLGVFGYFLSILRGNVRKDTIRKARKEHSLSVEEDSEEVDIPDRLKPGSLQEDILEEKDICKRFYASLSADEMKILKIRTRLQEKGKPVSLMKIAEKLDCSFSKVQALNKTIECKFRSATNYM